MTDAVVSARKLMVAYGRGSSANVVFRDVDLSLRPGEVVGIQGPSGCGKSTLLRVISSLERPAAGELFLGGRRVVRTRRDGFVMPINQNVVGALDPRWPIWKCVTEPLMARQHASHPSARERRQIARDYLSKVGLEGLDVETRPTQLSGGQCQRISILRALVARPRLLVADEPTAALDVSVAAGVLRLLSDAADGGISVLMASHDRTALQVLCHRILQMREGSIVSEHRGDRASLPSTTAQVAPLDGVPAVRGSGSSPNSCN